MCLLLQDLLQGCSRWGGGNNGGHVLRETTSRGLCGLVCPSRKKVLNRAAGNWSKEFLRTTDIGSARIRQVASTGVKHDLMDSPR